MNVECGLCFEDVTVDTMILQRGSADMVIVHGCATAVQTLYRGRAWTTVGGCAEHIVLCTIEEGSLQQGTDQEHRGHDGPLDPVKHLEELTEEEKKKEH